MDDKQFDQIIKKALSEFENQESKSDWGLFESLLDQSNLEELDNAFDSEIRNKVFNYQVPNNPNSWAQLEQRMEHSLHDEYAQELDQWVSSRVKDYRVPYQSDTWPILERKLAQRQAYIRKLIVTKSIEAALVLFAIFTFYKYFPYYHQQYLQHKEEKALMVDATDISSLAPISDQTFASNATETMESEESQSNLTSLNGNETWTSQTIGKSDNQRITGSITKSDAETPNPKSIQEGTHTRAIIANAIEVPSETPDLNARSEHGVAQLSSGLYPSKVTPVMPNHMASARMESISAPLRSWIEVERTKLLLATQEDLLGKKTKIDKKEILRPVELGRDIAFAALENKPGQEDYGLIDSISPNQFDLPKKKGWRLGISGSADVNNVTLSSSEFIDKGVRRIFREQDLVEYGYSFGLGLIHDREALSFASGFNYSSKSYNPNRRYEAGKPSEGITEVNYLNIQLQIIEIPLQVLYRWLDAGRVQVYNGVGGSINAIAVSDHDIVIPKPKFFSLVTSNVENSSGEDSIDRVKQHWLSGDRKNVYFTISAFMGVEYRLTEKYAVFSETAYSHQLSKGIGPNKDFINTASLRLGARMAF